MVGHRMETTGSAMIATNMWDWTLFGILIGIMLAADLVVSNRGGTSGLPAAARWSALWIGLGLLFGLWLGLQYGREAGVTYLTAYLLEQTLSIDNLFVFVLVFSLLQIPPACQRRVLLWGILGALVMRGVMIGAGVYLIERFHWAIYLFAVLLLI